MKLTIITKLKNNLLKVFAKFAHLNSELQWPYGNKMFLFVPTHSPLLT